MNKPIRKAVRSYLIKDEKVVVIKYRNGVNCDYYDIPGGKIEDKETSEFASIREFKEETGIEVLEQHKIGRMILDYPSRIFDFEIYIIDKFKGEPQDFVENFSMWKSIDSLLNEEKTFPNIKIISQILNSEYIGIKFYIDDNHNILEFENI